MRARKGHFHVSEHRTPPSVVEKVAVRIQRHGTARLRGLRTSHRVGTLPASRDQGRAGCCAAASSSSAPRALSSALASSLQSARRPSSSSRGHAQWSTPLFPRHTIVRALADALQRLARCPICISRAFPPRREGPPPTEYPSRRHNTDFPPPPHASHRADIARRKYGWMQAVRSALLSGCN